MRLKPGPDGADNPAEMFFPCTRSESPDPARLVVLRLSLNAPVVGLEGLPTGPARAAIAVWWDLGDQARLEIRLRADATGQLVVYAPTEAITGAGAAMQNAVDAALSFGEGMGFLFDDDLIARDGADSPSVGRAWAEFVGPEADAGAPPLRDRSAEVVSELAPAPAEPLPELGEPGTVLLDAPVLEPAPPAAAPAEPPAAAPAEPPAAAPAESPVAAPAESPVAAPAESPVAAPAESPVADLPAPRAAAPSLSKFRSPASAPPPEARAPGRPQKKAALGRVALVKRKSADAARPRPGFLARILGAY